MKQPFLKYHSYYSDPGIREVCHAVKQSTDLDARQAAINSMADYFSNLGVFDSSCILIPAPQHSGNAEYTKTISEIVSKRTGATMLDIVKCQPHEPLYNQKYKGNKVLDLDLYLAGKVPEGKKIILIDNVISTGETVFKISNLLKKPVIPVVYAIDDTRFKRWSELNNMIDKAMKTQQSADKEIIINSTDEERTSLVSRYLSNQWKDLKENFIHNLRSFTDDSKFAVQSLGNAIKEAAKPSSKYEIADRSAEIEKPKEVRKAKIDRSGKPNIQNDTLKSKQKEVEEYKKEHTVSPQQHNKNRGR